MAAINTYPVIIAPIARIRPGGGKLGLAHLADWSRNGALTGTFNGAADFHCDAIRGWGAAAVLSLSEEHEPTAFSIAAFSQAVRERSMHFYHLPIRDRSVPDASFEERWISVGAHLRAMLRQGFSVAVHCEAGLGRSAMIISRLMIELGLSSFDAYQALRAFRPGLIDLDAQNDHLIDARAIPEPMPQTTPAAIRDRALGALLGLAIGDAFGRQLRSLRPDDPLSLGDPSGGGAPELKHGGWTQVTAAALALTAALAEDEDIDDRTLKDRLIRQVMRPVCYRDGLPVFDMRDGRFRSIERGDFYNNPRRLEHAVMERFAEFAEQGLHTWNGRDMPAGAAIRDAVKHWQATGLPFGRPRGRYGRDNGSLVRLAPVAIRFFEDRRRLRDVAARQSHTTHSAPEAVDACIAYAELLADAIEGKPMTQVLADQDNCEKSPNRCPKPRGKLYIDAIEDILAGSWRGKQYGLAATSGEAVDSLEAALWCIGRTGSFAQALLTAARLGKQPGPQAAITGQLAGALYGASAIPQAWRDRLFWHDHIATCAEALLPEAMRGEPIR